MGSQFLVPLDHYVNFRLARCFGSLNRETYRRAPWLVREPLAHQYRISTSGSSCLPKDAHIMNDCLFSLATLDGNRSSHALRHFNSRVGNGAGTLMFRLPGESPGEPITSLSLGCSSNSWQSQSEEEPVRYAKLCRQCLTMCAHLSRRARLRPSLRPYDRHTHAHQRRLRDLRQRPSNPFVHFHWGCDLFVHFIACLPAGVPALRRPSHSRLGAHAWHFVTRHSKDLAAGS